MSDYNVITGIKVKDLAGNPANVKEGEVWYNTSTSKIRVRSTGTLTAWSAENDLNLGRSGMQGGFGTATAAAAVSGVRTPYPTFDKTETEIWNGTNWTEVNDVNVGRYNRELAGLRPILHFWRSRWTRTRPHIAQQRECMALVLVTLGILDMNICERT